MAFRWPSGAERGASQNGCCASSFVRCPPLPRSACLVRSAEVGVAAGDERRPRSGARDLGTSVTAITTDDRGLRAWLRTLASWQRTLLIGAVVGALLLVVVAAVLGVAYWSVYSSASIPAADELETPEPTVMLDQDGEQVATLEPAELRRNIDIEDLPEHVPDAVLAAEDRRFHDHGGFSIPGMARAAWANVTAGEVEQGASTIHQQYVSLAIADIGGGYVDKFREAATASRLDDEVDKATVLEMYLNSVPFGRTAQGIEAAARTYFDVQAHELDVEQAALLAGMIAAPTAFDPAENPEGAAVRRDFALEGMVEMGALDREEANELIGTELPELRDRPLVSFGDDAFFLETVRNQVPNLVDDEIGDPSLGLVVHTTLDSDAQQLAVDELREQLADQHEQGALATLESRSGAVRALVGGLDYEESQYNVAFSGDRQPGSAFKTFTLVELINQGYDPDSTRIHAPEEYDIEQEGAEDHTVGNYTDRGYGEVSAREATEDSINTAFIQLIEELGEDEVAELATDMGIESDLQAVPSLTLGTSEVMPLELTVAYATLAAEGTRHEPFMIERIEDHESEVVFEHEADADGVLDPEVAHVVTDVLVDVVERGTGAAANLSRPNAGKTGTTDNYSDAWFVGYTPHHTTTVWVGNLDSSPMEGQISGGSIPSQVWGSYMDAFVEDVDVEEFPEPDTSGLSALTDLERPEPEPEETRDPDDVTRDDEDDEEDEEDEENGEPGPPEEDDPSEDDVGEGEDEDLDIPETPEDDGDDDGDDGEDHDGEDDDDDGDDGEDDDGEDDDGGDDGEDDGDTSDDEDDGDDD